MRRLSLRREEGRKFCLIAISLSLLLSAFSALHIYGRSSTFFDERISALSSIISHGPAYASSLSDNGRRIDPKTPILDVHEDIKHNWGPYTPYHPVSAYVEVPSGCEISQVNIVSLRDVRFNVSS